MKKKRNENKKNGSSSNAATGAKKGGSDGSSSAPNDKHHSMSTPCSNLAAAIAQEIFPSMAPPPTSSSANGAGSAMIGDSKSGKKDADGNGGSKRNGAAGKKSKIEKATANDNDVSTSIRQEEQPLLGYMIQSYLVEERIKARAELGIGSNAKNAGSSKKKKNKKKKKKKSASTIASSTHSEGLAEQVGMANAAAGGAGDNDCQAARVSTMTPAKEDTKSSLNDSKKAPISLPAAKINQNNPSSSPQNEEKSTNERSSLDCFLDSIIDSGNDAIGKRSNRDIESFSAFLSRKLESHNEQKQQQSQNKKDKSNKSSSTTPSSDNNDPQPCGGMEYKDILPTISINDAYEQSHAAECRKCRTSATSRLRHLIGEEMTVITPDGMIEIEHQPTTNKSKTIVLNGESGKLKSPRKTSDGGVINWKGNNGHSCLSIPISSMLSDGGIEHAFDYVNMDDVDLEAGERREVGAVKEEESAAAVGTTSLSSFHLELKPISPASEKIRFMQIGTVTKEGGKDGGNSYPMNTQDIINLVKCILLPCGMEQGRADASDAAEGDSLGRIELEDIALKACEALSAVQSDVYNWKASIYRLKEEIKTVNDVNNRSVFDVKTPKILNDIEVNTDLLLQQMRLTLFRLFKSTCFVGWSSEYGKPLLEYVLQLWERYHQTLCQLVEPTLKHRGQLIRMAIREGEVPQAFTNKLTRNSWHDLAKMKISTLDSLVLDLSASLKGKDDGPPSPVVRLCVLEAYRQHVEPKVTSENDVFPDQEGQDMFQRLITAAVNLSQKLVGGGTLDVIKTKVQDQRAEIVSLCRNVRKIIIAMEDLSLEAKVDFLDSAYKQAEDKWYDVEKQAIELARTTPSKVEEGDMEYETKDAMQLLHKSLILIYKWIILLTSRQCKESPMKALILPKRLKTWTESVRGTKLPRTLPGTSDNTEQACVGDGGERRVSSILAALLYRWLEASCSEWHAELTRDELLQSMDMEEPLTVREGSNKSGKKKKSKRKSGGGNNKGSQDAVQNNTRVATDAVDAAEKKLVVDERITATVQTAGNYHELVSQDEKKDDLEEEGVIDESPTLKTESIQLPESLPTVEEIGTCIVAEERAVARVPGEERTQKKSKRKSEGSKMGLNNKGTKSDVQNSTKEIPSTQISEPNEHQDSTIAEVEKKDNTVEVPKESQTIEKEDDDKATPASADDRAEKESSLPAEGDEQSHKHPQEDSNILVQEGGLDDLEYEYHPCVGIIDGKHVVPAETYLVQRLQAISELKETGEPPIVWM